MMASWRSSALVWVNDDERGRVVIGPFGFAWWKGRVVHVGVFDGYSTIPMTTYSQYVKWDDVKKYNVTEASLPAVLRFVRTGLLPTQTPPKAGSQGGSKIE